jgi:hypothetical protein
MRPAVTQQWADEILDSFPGLELVLNNESSLLDPPI